MVCTRCFTYNHAPYIVDALNGFTMQQTTFPFVCTIIDDASTDGEQEVIKSYLKEHFDLEDKATVRNEETEDYFLTFARHKTNENCFFAVLYLKYNHYSIKKSKFPYLSEWSDNAKYIALCEGDDYWTHPKKLQMQVEFLEKHEDYGLCHTGYLNYYVESGKQYSAEHTQIKSGNDFRLKELLCRKYSIGTLTVLYRAALLNMIPHYYVGKGFLMGDLPLWIELASLAKIGYINERTSVRNVLTESASHSSDKYKELKFYESVLDIVSFYSEKLGVNISKEDLRPLWDDFHLHAMKTAYMYRDFDLAKKTYSKIDGLSILSIKTRIYYYALRNSYISKIVGHIFECKR